MQIDQNKKKIKKGLTRDRGLCYYNQAVASDTERSQMTRTKNFEKNLKKFLTKGEQRAIIILALSLLRSKQNLEK